MILLTVSRIVNSMLQKREKKKKKYIYIYIYIVKSMIVKISIWILQSYDFTISSAQNNSNLSRIFAIVQDR